MRTLKRSIWPPILSLAVVATAVVGGVTVNQSANAAPSPVASERLEEDDPRFDCRYDGNKQCGVFLMGEWRVINYDESGKAVSVYPRGA